MVNKGGSMGYMAGVLAIHQGLVSSKGVGEY